MSIGTKPSISVEKWTQPSICSSLFSVLFMLRVFQGLGALWKLSDIVISTLTVFDGLYHSPAKVQSHPSSLLRDVEELPQIHEIRGFFKAMRMKTW